MGIPTPTSRDASRGGFTLVELVIVLGMLVVVLGVTYRIMLDCLDAERTVERLSAPDKVGEGVLSLVRTDLAGLFYRNMGRRIFFVADAGLPPDARDEIRFLTTVEPTPVEETGRADTISVRELRTVLGIVYFLRPSQNDENVPAFTLFRREIVDLDPMGPLDGPGTNFEIYDKVAYFNVECFDGWSWYQDWDSEMRIQAEESDLEAEAATYQGRVGRVSDTARNQSVVGLSTPGVAPDTGLEEEDIPPPSGIPVAIRVELGVYVSVGGRILRDATGNPVLKTYSTLVPVLVAQRLRIEIEEDLGMAEDGTVAADEGGADGRRVIQGGAVYFPPGTGPSAGRGGRGSRGEGMGPGGRGGRGGPGGGRASGGGRGSFPTREMAPTGRTVRRPPGSSAGASGAVFPRGGAPSGGGVPLPSGGRR